jgi:hypothetical protein
VPIADHFFQLGDLPDRLLRGQVSILLDRDASRVVSAVFQPLEPLQQQWDGGSVTDVAYDSTHEETFFESCLSRRQRAPAGRCCLRGKQLRLFVAKTAPFSGQSPFGTLFKMI